MCLRIWCGRNRRVSPTGVRQSICLAESCGTSRPREWLQITKIKYCHNRVLKKANSNCLQWLVNFSYNCLGAWDPKSWQTWDLPSGKRSQSRCGEPVVSRDPPWALQLELKAELVGSSPGSIIYWARVNVSLQKEILLLKPVEEVWKDEEAHG